MRTRVPLITEKFKSVLILEVSQERFAVPLATVQDARFSMSSLLSDEIHVDNENDYHYQDYAKSNLNIISKLSRWWFVGAAVDSVSLMRVISSAEAVGGLRELSTEQRVYRWGPWRREAPGFFGENNTFSFGFSLKRRTKS